MKFKGDIVITDPCYIMRRCPLERPKPEDFNLPYSINAKPLDEFSTPDELAYKKACDEYWKVYKEYDGDWSKCEYGDNMEILGINNYICKSTLYGDWSCTTWSTPRKDVEAQIEEISNIYSEMWDAEEQYGEDSLQVEAYDDKLADVTADTKEIGHFCADAGLVAVFLLDEVLKYNPDFTKWMKEHSWCATLIKDFDGDVYYYVDNNGDAHIIGSGNINFFTSQTGL